MTPARPGAGPRRILVIEDDPTLNRLLVEQLGRLGHDARGVGSRADALDELAHHRPELAVLDLRLPDADGMAFLPELREYCPAIVLTAQGSIDQAVQAVRAGASDFLVKPASAQALDLALSRVFDTIDLRRDLAFWQTQATRGQDQPLEGQSPQMSEVRRLITLFAGADSPLLILGEGGTGKERAARALHALSPRANGRFVAADCEAGMTAEELFGEFRTGDGGALRRSEGLLAAADTGSIYLSGVDRLSADLQMKLLRVIETAAYRPVGSATQLVCRARFMLGASLSAEDIARTGPQHSELLFRLLAFVIRLPALRERPDDILPLAQGFLADRSFQRNTPKSFSPAAMAALRAHPWPGNLRELSNAVERAIILSAGSEVIEPAHLGLAPQQPPQRDGQVRLAFDAPPTLDELRDAYLRLALEMTGGNRREMAEMLGISERNLYRLLPGIDTRPRCEE